MTYYLDMEDGLSEENENKQPTQATSELKGLVGVAMTPSQLSWAAAGNPIPALPAVLGDCICSVCGGQDTSSIALVDIETPTMGAHSDIFRYGGKYVCRACAWLFVAGKGAPGNFVVAGSRIEYTVISLESVVETKRPWLHVLRDLAQMDPAMPTTGVMTTDVKPRLWPRMRLATIGAFGLYLHALDYDVSEWRSFGMAECLAITEAMHAPLIAGFAKASLYFGLYRDYARASKRLDEVADWERDLSPLRRSPAFLPALIAAGVVKGDKHDVKRNQPNCHTEPTSAGSHQSAPSQPGLF